MAMNLHSIPDFLSISQMLKATPHTEGGDRFIYFEVNNEALNVKNEAILSKALEDSADYYLRYGNVDLDHFTQVNPARGHHDRFLFEIGQPIDVRVDGKRTFVKAQIFSGSGPAAEKANEFWESITAVSPAQNWYPNIGGQVLEKSERTNARTLTKQSMVTRIRWTNIGMSRSPTNSDAPVASTIPFGVLAKCWSHAGLNMTKAINLTLKSVINDYWDFEDKISNSLLKSSTPPSIDRIFDLATSRYGMEPDTAAEYLEKFLFNLERGIKRA